jgi:glutaredoxin 3
VKIEIFSKTDCPYCQDAKAFLKGHGIPYTETVLDDFDARNAMYDRFGLVSSARTVPQIVVDGSRIGGFRELKKSDVVDRFHAGNFDEDF